VPLPTEQGKSWLREASKVFSRKLHPTTREHIYALSERNSGSKARRYKQAADDYLAFGLNNSDANVKMFIKAERFNPNAKVNPDPRAIQFRGPRYCVALSSHLRPIEEQIYLYKHASDGVEPTRNVAKGLNSVDRADLLVTKAAQFEDPLFVVLDASRFDQHVSVDHLRAEHRVYRACNSDREFMHLLSQQLSNKCFTTLGIKYTTCGGRMSGDMNTAVGNIVIMLLMVIAVCRFHLALPRWDCLDDGDDCIIIIERSELPIFTQKVSQAFLEMGMEMKIDAAVDNIHKVNFCRSNIVEFQPGKVKFVRNYVDVMSKALCGVRNWDNETYRSRTIHATGTCELVLNLGVPILQEFALALLRGTSGTGIQHAPDGLQLRTRRELKQLGMLDTLDIQPQEIHPIARHTFWLAFGVDEERQLRIERSLRNWCLNPRGLHHFGNEIDVSSWTLQQSYHELVHLLE